MQVLKDTIKKNIDSAAKSLFLEGSYEQTSMKSIANKAGISKSNMYTYYPNKEAIFASLTNKIRMSFDEFSQVFIKHQFGVPIDSQEFIEAVTDGIHDNIMKFADEMLLLLDCAEGTSYANYKEDLILLMAEHFSKDTKASHKIVSIEVITIISANLIQGIIHIVKVSKVPIERRKMLFDLIKYHINGFRRLLK